MDAAAFAHHQPPKQSGRRNDQNLNDRHLETLIDPCRAAVCGEDDQRDQDQTKQQGKEVFAGEDVFH